MLILKLMHILLFVSLISLIRSKNTSVSLPEVEVETKLGSIRGTHLKSRLGEDFLAFRGIRYAKPPVKKLRFRNPEPVESWKPEIFDATIDGPICPQITEEKYASTVSEDCLRLNVYTRDVSPKQKKPVLVYLHPGGFYSFSATSTTLAGPENLMDRDLVLVTVQYRLGSLGFMATGTAEAPGNAGLKDQVLALRWIQDHIENFGGDRNSVTVWGYSAGSLSIGLHLLSPMSRGLFHRAIMMSASPLGQFKYGKNQLDLAKKQAKLLNCTTEDLKAMVDCLEQKPVNDYIDTMRGMFEYDWNPVLNWMPVIEDKFNQEQFLAEDPYEMMLRGDIMKVPLITGITENEFYYMGYYALRNDTQRERFNKDFNHFAPIYFLYERETDKANKISETFRDFYLQNQTVKYPESLEAFGKLYSDGVIGYEYHRFLKMASKHIPVYTYLFKYKGRHSFFRNPETNQTHGAMHHDELLYLLNIPLLTPLVQRNDPENLIVEELTRMWFEFASKSDPNNPKDEYLKNLKWDLYTPGEKEYLEIGDELKMKTGGIYTDRFEVWEKLFPIDQKP